MALIKLKNISKYYGNEKSKFRALNSISLSINKGEFIGIIGTSGSGKSTLLNILGCLDICTNGVYELNEKDINKCNLSNLRNKTFGFVVQDFALIADYDIYENIVIPLEYTSLKKKEKYKLVQKYLKLFNLEDKINCYPRELSGGQCQRVAIARALINNPNIILADEPTGALDSKNSIEIMDIFKELNNNGKTIIVVTHDEVIANYCDRIIQMEDGEIISDSYTN